ncbi:hypothetical protein L7F22_038542 [Adiantum nelumboides]|nr:hypothetical protein [Adiantum nelumboides]MCO5584611.1 hypothetical protein [Adiantum nelumboides]
MAESRGERQVCMMSLKSCEGDTMRLQRDAALHSGFLRDILSFTFCARDLHADENGDEAPIPVCFSCEGGDGANAHTLSKVIEYCSLQSFTPKTQTHAPGRASWSIEEAAYIDGLGGAGAGSTLFKVMMAADYMQVEGLLDLTCEAVADTIRNKSVEEIRELFNIQNDFSPEEEEANLHSYGWAFEGEEDA